jgi:hypothetical protein
VSSVSSAGEQEDIEELDVLTDDIGMPISDENDPNKKKQYDCQEYSFNITTTTIYFIKLFWYPGSRKKNNNKIPIISKNHFKIKKFTVSLFSFIKNNFYRHNFKSL